MLVKPSFSDQHIIDCLSTYYGIKIFMLTFLPWSTEMNSAAYKAHTQDGFSYFIKLKRGHDHDIGMDIVALLLQAGIQQIIPPIRTMQGQLTQFIFDFTLIVYPFIEGQDGFSRDLTDNQWIELGNALRQVHGLDVPLAIKNQLRQENYSPKWRDSVRSLYATHIDAEPSGDEIAQKLAAFMIVHKIAIHKLVDRAEQLAYKIQSMPSTFVLCHADIHGGNVLIEEKTDKLYIVDWDEPMMAPKERDLMFIGGGVANVWNKPYEEALFYQGYGKTEINMTLLVYYRHERIVKDIAEYGQALLLSPKGGEGRAIMLKHFIDMFEPRGVVDIAFETNKRLNIYE